MHTLEGCSEQGVVVERPALWIFLLFFCSGVPALIYQIVWQRSLFAIYGLNTEAVTVDVSAFMLGLGVGSLIGGAISRSRQGTLIGIFASAELGTAVFGFFSLRLFHRVGELTVGASPFTTALITISLLLLPTVLMGLTLPLLVEYLARSLTNVGVSVGGLYFVNTLGSGAACFLASTWLMEYFGQSGSVRFAASINVCVAAGALLYKIRIRPQRNHEFGFERTRELSSAGNDFLPFWLALACAIFGGFAALSYEILWYRLLGFALADTAAVFASLLGAYLFGIALGARFAERFSRTHAGTAAILRLSTILFASGLCAFMVAPASGLLLHFGSHLKLQGSWPVNLAIFILIGFAAWFFGATFPLIAHVSVDSQQAGAELSYLYAANIAGSTIGTLSVGFVLLDQFSLFQISLGLFVASILFSATVAGARSSGVSVLTWILPVAVFCGLLLVLVRPIFDTIYDRVLFKNGYPEQHFQRVVQNRSGIVGVTPDGTLFGGGVYDGRFSVDLLHDVNIILRPYALSAFHSAPHRVLMIGLGSGSWAQVLANHPQVEQLTIVEINPGYLQLIPQYRVVASLLQNRKAEIVIDDGRRWLLRNPEKKFDVVVMNTSFYWRNHSSDLLSVEFLQIVRQHLKPGGVFFYNTTRSDDVVATALSVYPYALRVSSGLAVSDSEIVLNRVRWRSVLLSYRIDGQPVVDEKDPQQVRDLDQIVNIKDGPPGQDWNSIESNEELRERISGRTIITDDNMGLEWRQAK